MEKENKLKKIIMNHLHIFALIMLLITAFIVLARDWSVSVFTKTEMGGQFLYGCINLLFTSIITLPILFQLNLTTKVGLFSRKGLRLGLLLGCMDLLCGVLYVGMGFIGFNKAQIQFAGITNMLVLLFTYITVGIMEEFAVRGILLQIFLEKWGDTKKGTMNAILYSSMVFGLQHIFQLVPIYFVTGTISVEIIMERILQVIYATIAGVFFGTVMLYAKKYMGSSTYSWNL